MGVIKQGILGGFSGKVGNVIGSSWKGIAVMKAQPLAVANPNTPAQQEQRGAMSMVVKASRAVKALLIDKFWNPFAQRMSGYNRFVQENIKAFDMNGMYDPTVFFSSRGSLVGPVVTAVSADVSSEEITVSFSNNAGNGDALASDLIVLTAYNETQDYWKVSDGTDIRSGGQVVIADDRLVATDIIRMYTSASRADVSKVSDSVYSTTNAIP